MTPNPRTQIHWMMVSIDSQVLDLLAEENQLNVYAGALEVRPPGAPTTEPHQEAIDCL